MIKRLAFLLLFLAASAFAQQGPPVTVVPTPVPVFAPFNGTTVTIVQTAGVTSAYTIFTPTHAYVTQKSAGTTYTFTPPPGGVFVQGQALGFISIPRGTSTFRTTAVGGGGGVACTSTVSGLVPTPPNDATKFLNGTCAFSVPGNVWQGCGSRGLGDGLNAIAAGTYLQFACVNDTGKTVTISAVHCFTDNAGTSSLALTNNAGSAILTGAVTCNATKASGGAAGTLSITTLAAGDALSFTFIADGTSLQTNWTVSGTF